MPVNKGISDLIRVKAGELGFDLCGIARAEVLEYEGRILSEWCAAGMNADMTYLGRNIEKRINPALLLPGARSVIVTGLNYYTVRRQGGNGAPVISRYAYGANYHDVIKSRLDKIIGMINDAMPCSVSRSFVDSAPLLEKAWARKAGLGWQGKHSILINRKNGSFFFLGIILTDLELDYDKPITTDHCGTCTLCMQACPTQAINSNRTIDARRCIAYQTIESREPVNNEISAKLQGNVFGCDICQEACPWNKNATPHKTAEFEIFPELSMMTPDDWKNLEREKFRKLFRKSAIGRKKFEIFMQNVTIVTK